MNRAALLAALVAGCGAGEPGTEDTAPGTPCVGGGPGEVCARGDRLSMGRFGVAPDADTQLAQTFRAPRTGRLVRLVVELSPLRVMPEGQAWQVVAEVRPASKEGPDADPATALARAQLPLANTRQQLAFEPVASGGGGALLEGGRRYAVVLRLLAPPESQALVGIDLLGDEAYGDGRAFQRRARATVMDAQFESLVPAGDVRFQLDVSDSGAP